MDVSSGKYTHGRFFTYDGKSLVMMDIGGFVWGISKGLATCFDSNMIYLGREVIVIVTARRKNWKKKKTMVLR